MPRPPRPSQSDLEGHYRALGLPPEASLAEIKTAFRKRAKELHPDRNASATAREDFQRVAEAYRILSDPDRRVAYDNGTTTRSTASASASAQASRPRPQATTPQVPTPCRRCGRIAAQPRHVEFPVVHSRLFKTRTEIIAGVYCRRCAEITALQASITSWTDGWWSFPSGPKQTVKALAVNLRGGTIPQGANLSLLMRQARAFLSHGENDLARASALQALAFASGERERQRVHTLIEASRGAPNRVLKDRWHSFSPWRVLQLSPIAAIASILIGFSLWWYPALGSGDQGTVPEPPTLTRPSALEGTTVPGLSRPTLLRTGRLYEVTAPKLTLRTGPGNSYRAVADLEVGAVVLVTENAPDGGWVRITTADGLTGFVPGKQLAPGLAEKALGVAN